FKGLDLNLLVALDTLLGERSVTQAAGRLHLTQSAVSNALARLRATLGDELLVPSGRRLVLTPFAEELRPQVRDILMRIDATVLARPQFRPESSQRHFRIACSDFMAEAVLADVVASIARAAPGIGFDLLPLVSNDEFERLQSGEIDLIVAPDHYCRPGHMQAGVFSEPWTCVAWARNRAVGRTVALEEFRRCEHVVLQPLGEVALDEHYLAEKGIRRRVAVSVPVFTWMPRLLVGTQRLALMPRRFALGYARTLPLRTVRPLFGIPPLNESMQWHPSRDRDPALAWLRQMILGVAARGGGATRARARRPAASLLG
ncbi:MAG: LysR family transcriptional regulator, partial [Steroidobacteraceae bacterium]